MGPVLEREEYIEQGYFFHTLRERMQEQVATQEILMRLDEEILSTTRLPMAIQFLATEIKHTGLLSSGFARLPHYFTPFQTHIMRQTEEDRLRFSIETGLLILEREAKYRAGDLSPAGLFVYQFESLSRNRLGYDQGLAAMADDAFYDTNWRIFLDQVRRQVGIIDFADLIYVRSALYVKDKRREDPGYEPSMQPLLGEKEGKIAKASRGRDPLFLFAALQRQLGYPEVPRPKPRDDVSNVMLTMQAKVRDLEMRIKLLEAEQRGQAADLTQFLGKPDLLRDEPFEE